MKVPKETFLTMLRYSRCDGCQNYNVWSILLKVKPDWLYIEVWRVRFHLWKSGNSDVWWTLKSHDTYRKTVCCFYYDGLWLKVVGRVNKVLLLLWRILNWWLLVGGALNSLSHTECFFIMTHLTKRIELVVWP